MKRLFFVFCLGIAWWLPNTARAVGVEGNGSTSTRLGVGVAAGLDQVGGYGQDAYPFGEIYGHAETRIANWLYAAFAASYRQDLQHYSYASSRWRQDSAPGVVAQALFGYDGRSFHISLGPWMYGSSRRRPNFRMGLLPYGVLRLRVGQLEHWHARLHIGDGAPFTGLGGYSARIVLGMPRKGSQALSGGAYMTLGEKVAGLTIEDTWSTPRAYTWRFGGNVGAVTDTLSRVELSGFFGAVW